MTEKKYKIEKGIKIPTLNYTTEKWLKLFNKMKKGDSVLFKSYSESMQFRGVINNRLGRGFYKSHILNRENHVRVWRLK